METQKIAKQMIGFQRTMFNNACNAATVLQDNSESMMNGYLKQFPWLTNEARKPFNDSITFFKESKNNCQKIIDEGFQNLEKMIDNK